MSETRGAGAARLAQGAAAVVATAAVVGSVSALLEIAARSARPMNANDSPARRLASLSPTTPWPGPNIAASVAFSNTVIDANVRGVCITIPIPLRRTRCAGRRSIESPSNVMVPEVGRSRPAIAFSRVLFPAPLGPTTATISPSSISNVIPSTAGTPPKCFVSASTSSSGVVPT